MMSDVLKRPTHVVLLMAAGILLAGCAATKPAPVVHRTSPQSTPPVATAPGEQPEVADQGPASDSQAGMPEEEVGAQVSPIYQGAIHQQGSNAAPDDPNLKVGPQGVKRPYGTPKPGAVASASQAGSSAAKAGAAAGAAGATGTATQAARTPAVPSETRNFDGVRFSWPVPGK
ncbi:MAG: hypothetical protein Q4D91_13990, partial [Lautropia sp.]|nr:hypothetical protein [Lautropia sp.]